MHLLPPSTANAFTSAEETIIRTWAAPRSIEVERDQTDQGETFFALVPRVGCLAEALTDLHLAHRAGRVVAIGGFREIASGRTVAEALAALEPRLAQRQADLAA